jgi:hypothetical protein
VKQENEKTYEHFLQDKQSLGIDSGFAPLSVPDFLFDFQAQLTTWAIQKGRAAIFADCGMGKTPMQLVWSDNVIRKTNKPVLILTPLAVSWQTLEEAKKFDIEAQRAIPDQISKTIQVTNYEKLHYFNPIDYAGIVCDESSILKNFDGKYKAQITEFMRQVPYRLLCTATAAPNDWPELGTSSEALGYMGYTDMLSKFFRNNKNTIKSMRMRYTRDKFFLRKYAEENFWRWVSSWSRAARNPSDLGFSNNGFELPPLIENDIEVRANRPPDGMLFDMEAVNWREEREAIKRTITERCEVAAERVAQHDISVVWCHLNNEGKLLKKIIPNSVEISGTDSDEKKEEAVNWFINGADQKRVLISKPKIFGFGMNFQHSYHCTYFPTHSYEQYYQATRRQWRFGQKYDVIVDRIFTNGGRRMLQNLDRKAEQANKMFIKLVSYMNNALDIQANKYQTRKVELPQWLQN